MAALDASRACLPTLPSLEDADFNPVLNWLSFGSAAFPFAVRLIAEGLRLQS